MSVFRAHRRKVSKTSRIATGGKPARRSKPAQSRPDRPEIRRKPHGMEVAGTRHPSWTGRQGSPGPGDGLGTQIGPHQTHMGSPGTFRRFLERSNVKTPPSHFKTKVCSLKMVNVWMKISTVMNHKGREPPVTCQKFGSGVAHTLISRQEVYDAMRSEGLQLRSGEVNEAQRGQVAKQGQVSISSMQNKGLRLRSGEVKGSVA